MLTIQPKTIVLLRARIHASAIAIVMMDATTPVMLMGIAISKVFLFTIFRIELLFLADCKYNCSECSLNFSVLNCSGRVLNADGYCFVSVLRNRRDRDFYTPYIPSMAIGDGIEKAE